MRIKLNFAKQGFDFIAAVQMKRTNFNGNHLPTNEGPGTDSTSQFGQPRI